MLETNAHITLEPRREMDWNINLIPIELPDWGKEYREDRRKRENLKLGWPKAVRQETMLIHLKC